MIQKLTRDEKVKAILSVLHDPIPDVPPIREVCGGTQFCSCHKVFPVAGGTLMSQYKRGSRTPEARAANAAYMRQYRKRK